MLHNLVIGTVMICLTVLIHTIGIMSITRFARHLVRRFGLVGWLRRVFAMVGVVLGIFAISAAEIWLWAGAYYLLGAILDFSLALYLSTVTYSTVGYGDVVPAESWRMLAALEGVTGFLMIGWSTAYLVSASTRLGPFRSGEHF